MVRNTDSSERERDLILNCFICRLRFYCRNLYLEHLETSQIFSPEGLKQNTLSTFLQNLAYYNTHF